MRHDLPLGFQEMHSENSGLFSIWCSLSGNGGSFFPLAAKDAFHSSIPVPARWVLEVSVASNACCRLGFIDRSGLCCRLISSIGGRFPLPDGAMNTVGANAWVPIPDVTPGGDAVVIFGKLV